MQLLADFWSDRPGEGLTKVIVGFFVGMVLFFALSKAPTRLRKYIVGAFTFVSGLFYVLLYVWPEPVSIKPLDVPANSIEGVGFFLHDTVPVVKDFSTILTAFLLGLGVFSLIRIHFEKFIKKQKDWPFSAVLLVSMVVMTIFGYVDFYMREYNRVTEAGKSVKIDYDNPEKWTWVQRYFDVLFDGLLQKMDAAMFSIIAFFILSAAYRAFRIRSVEASIMLASALLFMLNLMPAVQFISEHLIASASHGDANHWVNNFRLSEMADWVKDQVQTPGMRAMDFGIGIGALAMGLRLWLNLERGANG